MSLAGASDRVQPLAGCVRQCEGLLRGRLKTKNEGRHTTFDGLAYIANYTDLMHVFGRNDDAGASHYINYGANEGRTTTFEVAGYEAADPDLQGRFASNDAFLAAHINNYTATGTFLT